MEDMYDIRQGDCREVMSQMVENSVDAIVTDPPYGLSFMGKEWDHSVPGVQFWTEAIRVAKPGAHLLAFGGTRTFHRLTCAIEDAGWEIRDCVMWVYGSSFPKSLDVSKAIDKVNGEDGRMLRFTGWLRGTGLTSRQVNEITGTFMGSHYLTDKSQPAIPTPALWEKLRPACGDVPAWVDDLVRRIAAKREVLGRKTMRRSDESVWGQNIASGRFALGEHQFDITAPATDAARKWAGWGTALKPAWEPVIAARKPLIGSVAENVLRHGTGAINVEGGRVESDDVVTQGRWPANVIHDGSDEVVGLFPKTSSGSAARFFYCAKASKADRDAGCERNHHPTVKPTNLMRYLCRLVTPPGGVVLDPFMGSGSTGKAAILEGFRFIGIDLNPEYIEIARGRIAQAAQESTTLF